MSEPSLPATGLILGPDPSNPRLTERVLGMDERGGEIETAVPVERALTLYLNAQEIVTVMTINDYPRISRSDTFSTRTWWWRTIA
jgi:FdhD protein